MNDKKYSFPLPYDIKEVLSNMTTSTFEKRFAQKRGIFMPNGSRKTLGEMLSLFLWDEDDINEIQNEAFQRKNTNALSGFTVKPEYKIDLADALSSLISKGEISDFTIDTPRKIENTKDSQKLYKSRLEYRKLKVAKLQFLQEELVDFDFYIKQKKSGEWQIEVDSKRSKDLSIIKKIYEKKLDIKKEIGEIEIDNLSALKTILFLDKLRNEGLSVDWEFRDIKQLTLKRAKLKKNNDDENNEDDEYSATEEEISGITQAILAGHHLREDPFVKKSEGEGYLFTSMTYLFYHKTDPLAIQIKAEFKGKPKVFEISIIKSVEIEGVAETLNDISLSKERDLEIRTEFWNNALKIFNKLSDE